MHVLHVTSELHPFSKTGGLADMVGALAKALSNAGLKVTVVTPLYRTARARIPRLKPLNWRFEIRMGARSVPGAFWEYLPESGERILFVEQEEFFGRAGIYEEHKRGYPDNDQRFIFLSRAAALLAHRLPDPPRIVHCHDWQSGLVPLLVHHGRRTGEWPHSPRTVLTIHNLAYQGTFPAATWALTGLPKDYYHLEGAEYWGGVSLLKTGLCFADVLTTVSPHYAREITTTEFGVGLDGLLRRRQADLRGILNGVDLSEWTTEGNRHLAASYTANDLRGKAACKEALQVEMGLPVRPDVPLFGNVGRLETQKGIDLLVGALGELLHEDIQFVQLGTGQEWLEHAARGLAQRFPGKAAIRIGFDNGLAHRIEAGSDFFIMPSRFEPCGLNQLYSLRYGTPPIVRDTGGLHDSVRDPREDPDNATGIKFQEPSSRALAHAMRKALAIWNEPALLAAIRRNGMTSDFSWRRQATEYIQLYGELTA